MTSHALALRTGRAPLRARLAGLLALLALAAPLLARQQGGDPSSRFVSRLAQAQEALLVELVDLASWCKSNKLIREAHLLYGQILQFDEDHSLARKELRYSRRGSAWVQSASYREPRNFSKSALEDFVPRRLAAMEEYKGAVFAAVTELADSVPLEARERALLGLLELTPDDPDVRAALGEARVGDEWRLVETARSLEARRALPDIARRCVLTVPQGAVKDPNGMEQTLGLDWSLVLEGPALRVAGTGTRAEVENVYRSAMGVGELFRTVLRTDVLPPPGFQLFLLSGEGEKRAFLDRHPRVSPSDRPFLEALRTAGIPSTGHAAAWTDTEVMRLDGSIRHTVAILMGQAFGITPKHGWAFEGMGLYLTELVCGTRLTYYLAPDRYAGDPNEVSAQKELLRRLYVDGADWLDEARLHFAERRPPKLAILFGRGVDTMSAQDLLWSYVLAAYLLEGWPEETPAFLRAVGEKKKPPHEAVREVFRMELPRFEQRLSRWLEETR